jgi:hypothetical protein
MDYSHAQLLDLDQARYRRCAERYSVSHMSNTKWRRIFHAIADAGIEELNSKWKHIDSDYITAHYRLPRHFDIGENRFNDGHFQPYEYKWIEWIRFPRAYYEIRHQLTRKQDLQLLEVTLSHCGAVKVVSTDEFVALIAYEGLIES